MIGGLYVDGEDDDKRLATLDAQLPHGREWVTAGGVQDLQGVEQPVWKRRTGRLEQWLFETVEQWLFGREKQWLFDM